MEGNKLLVSRVNGTAQELPNHSRLLLVVSITIEVI